MPTVKNLTIYQGASFSTNVIARVNSSTSNVINLAFFPSSDARSYIRKTKSFDGNLVGTFVVNTHIANTSGIVSLSMDHFNTSQLPTVDGSASIFHYDVVIKGYLPGGVGPFGLVPDPANPIPPGTTRNVLPLRMITFYLSNTFNSTIGYPGWGSPFVFPLESIFGWWAHQMRVAGGQIIGHPPEIYCYTTPEKSYGTFWYDGVQRDDLNKSLKVQLPHQYQDPEDNWSGWKEIVFANVVPTVEHWACTTPSFSEYYANGIYTYTYPWSSKGNSYMQPGPSQVTLHGNGKAMGFLNVDTPYEGEDYGDGNLDDYGPPHSWGNSHPLDGQHFATWGVPITPGKRWIYSVWVYSYAQESVVRLQAYTANSTHDPNTTVAYTKDDPGGPYAVGATGPHQSANLYPDIAMNVLTGSWWRASTVIDLRDIADPTTHPDYHKYRLVGNTHVQNATNPGFGTQGRLHFRDQNDNLVNSTLYPEEATIKDAQSPPEDNEIQYWQVGDEIAIDYVGGNTSHIEGGRVDFWGTPWSRAYRTITAINENAPWIDLTIPGGAYGGAIRIPDSTANSTHNPEVFAQTVNLSLQRRNELRFAGANTHDSIILSISPCLEPSNAIALAEQGAKIPTANNKFTMFFDGFQLEEQSDANVSTPTPVRELDVPPPDKWEDKNPPVQLRIAEGKITVHPGVTRQ